MKFSNFRIIKETKDRYGMVDGTYAEVDVEVGNVFFGRKKKITKQVCKKNVNWFFVDSGEFCPGFEVEKLEKAYRAQAVLND